MSERTRRILITGASHGVGRGIARVLARSGHLLGLLGRDEDRLHEVVSEIAAEGGRACGSLADLRDPGATRAATRGGSDVDDAGQA